MRRFWLITITMLLACGVGMAAPTYTYVDLVNRLTDLEGLAVLPVKGETCAQLSSWDRASKYDDAAGKYVGWDANGDWGGAEAVEGENLIAGEIKGPGCIWRIWSARAEQGHVKIYLDGSDKPAVDLPFIGYFDGKTEPFNNPALVHKVAMGLNNYTPIAFQKSCRIVLEKGWGAYYHFTYSTFPENTKVPTFTMDLSAEEKAALAKADRFLRSKLSLDPAGRRNDAVTVSKRISLAPGKSATVAEIAGKRAITGMWVKVDPSLLTGEAEVLRDTILTINWDGEKSPSVWSPLGDFFGMGRGYNKYKSLPLGVTDDGMYCYWYMPFAESALVQLANDGKQTFNADVIITHAPVRKAVNTLGRFHAKWHRDEFLPTEPERWIDWRIVETQGSGRFLGVALEIWNPRGSWWGEGDEKFYVDGEKFPSTFGTGSEDYFGYAWCFPEFFQHAYHNQPRNVNNVGHVSNNRWHIADNVPFMKSFEGDIEKYYVNDRPTLYACTAYWYLSADGVDPYTKPVKIADRRFYVKPKVVKKPGVIEGEEMTITAKTGVAERQDLAPFNGVSWSGESHLWWREGKPGDKLEVEVPVTKSGKYDFIVAMTKAADYGIVQFYLDGQKIASPFDLYNNGVVPTGEISLGRMDLSEGVHKLAVEIVGANDRAVKAYMFGLDYVKLAAVKGK